VSEVDRGVQEFLGEIADALNTFPIEKREVLMSNIRSLVNPVMAVEEARDRLLAHLG